MGSTVLSTRLDEETYREFVEAVKTTKGSDAIASDVLKELIAQFISKALVGPSYPQECAEGPSPILKQSNRIKEDFQPNTVAEKEQSSEGATETPLDHGVNSEAAYKEPGNASPTTTLKLGLGEASKEASKVAEITPSIGPVKVGGQQCYYYTVGHKKGFMECMRKYAKENVIDLFTQQICDYCWSLDPYRKYPIPNSQITDDPPSETEPLNMRESFQE